MLLPCRSLSSTLSCVTDQAVRWVSSKQTGPVFTHKIVFLWLPTTNSVSPVSIKQWNRSPCATHALSVSTSLQPVSLSARLLPVAVYKSGRRLYPPTTVYRMDRERWRWMWNGQRGPFSEEGLGGTRSVPVHPAQTVQPRCIVRESVTRIGTCYHVSRGSFFLPPTTSNFLIQSSLGRTVSLFLSLSRLLILKQTQRFRTLDSLTRVI